jgi:hypothetical protein
MVQLLAKDENNLWVNLDLSSDLVISLNRSIEEIEDITQRRTSFSKTFEIPGTDVNDRFFKSAFDVNVTDFNSTLQVDCLVQENGNDLFRGTLRLNKISITPNGNLYEVYILEDTISLSTTLQGITLCDLDFSDIDHEVNYDNIVSTWNYSGGSYDSYSGIVGKVLYPLAHTGYDTDIGYGEWNFGASGLTNSGTPLSIGQFKPWINVKYLFDKLFEYGDFSYSSEFLNSDYFKSIFVLAGTSDTSATKTLGDRPENQNFFNVSYQGTNYFYPPEGEYPNYNYTAFQTVVFNTEEYDYLNQYTLSNFPESGAGTGGNFYLVPIDGTYQFRVKQTMFLYGSVYAPTYVNVVLRDIDTGAVQDSYLNVVIPVGSPTTYDFFFTATMTKGQRVSVQFNRVPTAGAPYNTIAFTQTDSLYESYVAPSIVPTIGDIKINDNLMCMNGLDYLKNLVKMFNLTIIQNGETNLIIEPYVNYLSTSSGTTLDWSNKLDLSQSYQVEPLDYSLQQELLFTYTEGKDYRSIRHKENFDKIFGERTFFKDSKVLTGEQTLQIGFESVPTEAVGNSGTTMVVPSIYSFDQEQSPQYKPVSTGMKIGFYTGLVPFYTAATDTTLATYYIQSGGTTSIGHNYYPCINHLSRLTDDINTEFSDLNFKPSWDYFKSKADFELYTANNVWTQFYKEYLGLLYSDDARLFTGKFKLTPEDITNINFNDTVYFLNSAWRLYQIKDGDITQEGIVECVFLKEPYQTTEITLVPPDYTGQTVTRPPSPTPTPTPVSCNPHEFYQSFNQGYVCDQTAPRSILYSNCSTISAGCRVYTDSGCSTPLNVGRFIYPSAASSLPYVYTVIDTNGTIAESLCS